MVAPVEPRQGEWYLGHSMEVVRVRSGHGKTCIRPSSARLRLAPSGQRKPRLNGPRRRAFKNRGDGHSNLRPEAAPWNPYELAIHGAGL